MWQRSRDAVIAAIAEHDCDASLRIAAEVAHLDPVHHASVLGAVSAIAACRAERDASLAERRNAEEARKADRRACLAVRAAIGRRAQTIADISRRVALLRTMPACPAD